jgi:hypothetical protein
MKVYNTDKLRICKSEDYNYVFDKTNGFFARWGKTKEDDPQFAPMPEILDIEVTTICYGVPHIDKEGKPTPRIPCKFCYKSNTSNGVNMTFSNFKIILDKMPWLLQVAFGADSECSSNPDIWKMMGYCREKGVVPNITVANITDETADNLKKYCGAVAVSRYDNKNLCYDSVKKLTDRGMEQINIHILVSDNTYDMVMETLKDRLTDKRLEKLNAIVLLNLKQKGRGEAYNTLTDDKFKVLVDFAFDNKITIGFDSCGCNKFLRVIKDYPNFKEMEMVSEPCESSLFSSYIDANGDFYPCSFCEGHCKGCLSWETGLSVLKADDFLKDIWHNEKTKIFRDVLLKNGRNCPMYNV